MTGQVQSVRGMFARWNPCFHGGCSFQQAVQLFRLPTNVTARDGSTPSGAVVSSTGGSEALGTCHGGSALPSSLQSQSPRAAKYYKCVCQVEVHYMASPSLPFTLRHVMPYITTILTSQPKNYLIWKPLNSYETEVEWDRAAFSFTSPHCIIIK